MSAAAVAQMLSTILYGRRFFPYYVSNVVAGLDEATGEGVIYSYDPVGHCEKGKFHAGGSSGALLQPLLDNQVNTLCKFICVLIDILKEAMLSFNCLILIQIAHLNMAIKPDQPLTLDGAKRIIKDVFISAAERDIYTGDGIILKIVSKNVENVIGITEEALKLRHD